MPSENDVTLYHPQVRYPWHHPIHRTEFVIDRFKRRMTGITTISDRPVGIPDYEKVTVKYL